MILVPLWEVQKGETPALGPDATALDASLSGAITDLIADNEFVGAAGSSAVVSLQRGVFLLSARAQAS